MLSASGLYPLRFESVQAQLEDAIQAAFGGGIDLSDDALIGIYMNVFGISETDLWELSQCVYDSSNLLSAEGIYLENLALLVGMVRLPAAFTRGILWVGAEDGTVLPAGARFQSVVGDFFLSETATNITTSSCLRVSMFVDSLVQGEDYTLTINGNTYRREPTVNQTKLEILQYFENILATDSTVTTEIKNAITDFPYLLIEKADPSTTMNISGTSYFAFENVVCQTIIVAEVAGAIEVDPRTVTKYIPAATREVVLEYVSNPNALVTGNDVETDGELRKRVVNHYTAVAGGTPDALSKALYAIQDVANVKIVENITSTTNPRGMPPKSFQVIVHQGNDQLIAEAIWKTKPAGIQCYADLFSPLTITKNVLDYNSQSHNIRFVRPSSKYIWIHCEYTLYNEEIFPDSGELIMKEELALYGQTLGIGNDVIPDRFYPAIYRNVKGVDDVELYFAVTEDLNTPPVYPGDYTQSIITITDEEITNFAAFRVNTVKI